ncbi:ATP-dependent DNA helicase RecQ-like [Montipora foliosa]|uniref:ATP-dependent DNA helicase RecQ-like n=1 Tax=Montipora foliosa TaxID=591990 RepID=UPI0035F1E9B4
MLGDFESSLADALKLFGIQTLKNEQRECLQKLVVEKRDVLAALPTGYGKSIIYQLTLRVFDKKSTVLVVSPLESIRDQQIRKLEKVGMHAVDLSDEEALSGIGKKGKKAFREAFGRLNEMRSFLGEVPVLCITATADIGMRRRLINYLSMPNPHKVILSPNKDNIRFSVNRADKELNCLNWIVKMLEKEREHCPYGIIFCQTVNDIALVLSYLLTKLGEKAYVDGETPIAERCLIGVYYSMTPQTLKDRVKSSFESGIGRARIVIANTSLRMGVDFPSVTYVIHFDPARDLVSHLQEAGRAGRDGGTQYHCVSWKAYSTLSQGNDQSVGL